MTTVRLPILADSAPTLGSGAPSRVTMVAGGVGSNGANGANGSLVDDAAQSSPDLDSGERTAVAAGASGDALMQVGDLARETGKTVRAIHLYEELDLLKPVARSKGRYRLYGSESLVRIRWIGKMQDMGFSLTDIQTVVRDWEESGSASTAMVKMREVFKKKIEETRAHMKRLRALEHELEASLDYLDTCDTCEPDRLLSACTVCNHHECNEAVPELVAGFHANGKALAPIEPATLKE